MKKIIFLALAAAAAVIGLLLMTQPKPQEWTTDSAEALAELQQGLESEMKLYHREAYEHFRAALDLDPDFVAARVFLSDLVPTREAKGEILQGLESASLERVTPRERLLARHNLAMAAGQEEEARSLLAKFLSQHPKDPFALNLRCQKHSVPQDVEDCYRQLIALEPNFVRAQNSLGYLAMGQGRFEEAEERFRTYQYLAPNQANPHDSMGELLLMLGRYDEAKKELEQALELRPDFVASYENLVRLASLQEDFEEARTLVRQVRELSFPKRFADQLSCRIDSEEAFLAGDWEQVWRLTETCRGEGTRETTPLRFRADLWTGRLDDAIAIETYAAKRAAGTTPRSEYGGNLQLGMQYHLKGLRLGAEGRLEEAAKTLKEADRWLPYAGYNFGALKIQNALTLASVLETLGKAEEAEAPREQVRRINPDFLRLEKLLALPRIENRDQRAD